MTTTAKKTRVFPYESELLVILLTLVALVAGWFIKTAVENSSVPFSASGVTAQLPAGWMRIGPSGSEIVHAFDRNSSGFPATYTIETRTVPPDQSSSQVASLVTLERGTTLLGYRVLGQQDVLVQGRKATEIDFVYVESAANLVHTVFPAVVHGRDYIFVSNGQAVIVGFRDDQSNFSNDLGRFYQFLVSVK